MATLGQNAVFKIGSNLLGYRGDPFRGFNFHVEVDGLVVGGFSEVSGLEVETEVQEYREGGLNTHMHKLPGASSYPSNLTLKHGLTDVDTLWRWHQQVIAGTIERRTMVLFLLDLDLIPTLWWNFKDAYPVKWTGPELKADSSTVAVETLELAHHGFASG